MKLHLGFALSALTALGCGPAIAARPAPPPVHHDAMVAAADPRAVAAALAMLERGGSATDAAIAASLVLGLVEPQSSGIGGGGFLLHFDEASHALTSYDGREMAPGRGGFGDVSRRERNTTSLPRGCRIGGPPSACLGSSRCLSRCIARNGRLPWSELFEPAISLAEQGFEVSERMARIIAFGNRDGMLARRPEVRAYLFDEAGAPWPAGHVIVNQAYADTLRVIQRDGSRGLLTGPIAQDIVAVAHEGREAKFDHARRPRCVCTA